MQSQKSMMAIFHWHDVSNSGSHTNGTAGMYQTQLLSQMLPYMQEF